MDSARDDIEKDKDTERSAYQSGMPSCSLRIMRHDILRRSREAKLIDIRDGNAAL